MEKFWIWSGKSRNSNLRLSVNRVFAVSHLVNDAIVVDPSVLQATLVGHTDAIWGLSMHNSKMHLLSCSSDATVRLWNPNVKSPLLSTFRIDTGTLLRCFVISV